MTAVNCGWYRKMGVVTILNFGHPHFFTGDMFLVHTVARFLLSAIDLSLADYLKLEI